MKDISDQNKKCCNLLENKRVNNVTYYNIVEMKTFRSSLWCNIFICHQLQDSVK